MGAMAATPAFPDAADVCPPRYRPRNPRATSLYQLLDKHYETVKGLWEERFERRYRFWRGYWDNASAISTADFSNPASPAPFARSVASSFSSRSHARAAGFARRAAPNAPPFFPSCFNKKFSPTPLTPNGFSPFQKCFDPTFYFIESSWESSHDSPGKPSAR